jgi:hypothetical protein
VCCSCQLDCSYAQPTTRFNYVPNQQRPGAQRHRKGPRQLEPTPARGGSTNRGSNDVPRRFAPPGCRRASVARRTIRAEESCLRSAERGRHRTVGVDEGLRIATRSSLPLPSRHVVRVYAGPCRWLSLFPAPDIVSAMIVMRGAVVIAICEACERRLKLPRVPQDVALAS